MDARSCRESCVGDEYAVLVTLAGLGLEGDEYATFSRFPVTVTPSAGHPLPALRSRPRLRLSNISEVLAEHHRRAHPEALDIPAP